MDKERLLLWIRAVLIFTPSSKRIWEVSANYDDIVEFMTALDCLLYTSDAADEL